MKTKIPIIAYLAALPTLAIAGDLQIHFIDVGQGDSELIISPGGETVLVDAADRPQANRVIAYLDQLGLSNVSYFISSHYDADHIGGAERVLTQFPVQKTSFDRGTDEVPPLFTNYWETVGNKRKTALEGTTLTLDAGSPEPVTLCFVARDGHGVEGVKNENDRCLDFVLHYGLFDAEFGGDLSGQKTSSYRDVETSVAPDVGQVEVYKVHHHGSRNNSNLNWLSTIKPKVAVISCGDGNKFKHPNKEAVDRLHDVGATVYWTETGNGVAPNPEKDTVGASILITVPPQGRTFTVAPANGHSSTFQAWNAPEGQSFAWSSKSKIYHYAGCPFVKSIRPENLVTASAAPNDKTLHVGCQAE
jgi:beta-lactamase superfamily II metal-dependent hydrolase